MIQMSKNEIILSAERAEDLTVSNIFRLLQQVSALTFIIREWIYMCKELLEVLINNTKPFIGEGLLCLDLPLHESSLLYIASEFDKLEEHGIKKVHFMNTDFNRATYQHFVQMRNLALENISPEVWDGNLCLSRK